MRFAIFCLLLGLSASAFANSYAGYPKSKLTFKFEDYLLKVMDSEGPILLTFKQKAAIYTFPKDEKNQAAFLDFLKDSRAKGLPLLIEVDPYTNQVQRISNKP
jgi:hypothetical protein